MKIVMLRDEIIAYGPQRVLAGEVLAVPVGVAAHLIETGAASPVELEVEAAPELDLSALTVKELKVLANEAGLDGYAQMKKGDLLEALSGG